MKNMLFLCLTLFLVSCEQRTVTESGRFKTIMIKSNGEIRTLPDTAEFTIELSCLDRSVKNSKDCLVSKSNELSNRLQELGIKKEDLLTTSVNLNKSYTWRNNSNVFEGYRSSSNIIVTVKDLDKLDVIYTELLENRNLNLSGLSYSHSRMDALKNDAYIDALKKAEVLSEKILNELPESDKEILKIGNVEITASLPQNMSRDQNANAIVEEVEAKAQQSIAINKGTIVVNATLYVEYAID